MQELVPITNKSFVRMPDSTSDSASDDTDSTFHMSSSDDEDDWSIDNEYENEDIMAMTFITEEEGFDFYLNYAKRMGFGIRKDIVRRDPKTNEVVNRRFLCSRAGERDPKHIGRRDRVYRERDLSRCECEASLSIMRDRNSNNWFVYDFCDTHTHELATSDLVPFIRAHRKMTAANKYEVLTCFDSGMRKSQTMSLMECKHGGYENVGFTAKDLYNFASVEGTKTIANGDARTVIDRMTYMKESDCEFFFKYETDSNGCLTNLFWADSQSRLDYIAYGDVLLFDSTYRTNRYAMPFIPFIGVNNHSRSTLFGCGLVSGETSRTYKWLLESFLEAMCQQHPISVITDGDNAMREAIVTVLPNTTHRLCAWHISRNLTQHVKDHELLSEFKVLIYDACDPTVFEEKWNQMVLNYEIRSDNTWFNMMYKKRELWAASYLREKYFLGMVSTQRSESMNAVFHRHLDRKMNLLGMVKHYERCLSRLRRNEARDDCHASQSVPVLRSELLLLEQHAASTYTPAIFQLVQQEILKEGVQPISNVDLTDEEEYTFEIDNLLNSSKKVKIVSRVIDGMRKISCDCLKWQTKSIPCRHMFSVMKHLKLTEIPDSCIVERWTKNVKLGFPSIRRGGLKINTDFLDRYHHLKELSDELMPNAARTEEAYFEVLDFLNKQLRKRRCEGSYDEHVGEIYTSFKRSDAGAMNESRDKVLDPCIVSTKGAPRKRLKSHVEIRRYKCGLCKKTGHTRKTCPSSKDRNVSL